MTWRCFVTIILFYQVFFSSTYSQPSDLTRDLSFEREFHKYEILVRGAEKHSKLIIDNMTHGDVLSYFVNQELDTNGMQRFIKRLVEECNFKKGIGAYIGFFLEDNLQYNRKMIHCVYEYELECGSKYIQFSYFLDLYTNKYSLKKFLVKATSKQDDIIMNVIKRN